MRPTLSGRWLSWLAAVLWLASVCGPRMAAADEPADDADASWRDRLYTPTYLTQLGDTWFIVVCWHHRILFHDGPEPDADLSNWRTMDEELAGPHSIAWDGELYVVDDTGRHSLKTFRRTEDGSGFERVQSIDGLGQRTHRVHYCEDTEAFYVLSSNSQDLYKFVREGWELKLEYHRPLAFLEGVYTRSFTLHEGHMYFTAGPGVIKARYQDDSYEVVARYPVPRQLAGMNDVFPASDGWWYVTATPQAIVRTRDLASLADGDFEDLQQPLGFRGTPYYLFEHEGRLWVPQITQHSGIVSFRLEPEGGELGDRRVLFDFGPPTAADRERVAEAPR